MFLHPRAVFSIHLASRTSDPPEKIEPSRVETVIITPIMRLNLIIGQAELYIRPVQSSITMGLNLNTKQGGQRLQLAPAQLLREIRNARTSGGEMADWTSGFRDPASSVNYSSSVGSALWFSSNFCTRQLFMSATNSVFSSRQEMPWIQLNCPGARPDSPNQPNISPSNVIW